MSKSRFFLGEYVSLRDGLSELESDFLSMGALCSTISRG